MNNEVTLNLSRLEAGQILDALLEQLEIWRYTERYMHTGYVEEPYCVKECTDENEAGKIAKFYESIIQAIEKQIS